LKLPDSLVSIGNSAFEYCSGMKQLDLGKGVSSIGMDAFNNCQVLGSISIPASVTNMGDSVFWYCTGLTNAQVADGVTSIGNRLFYECSKLTTVKLGNGVTNIGAYAFYGCSQLPTITLPATVSTISTQAFAYCSALTNVYFTGNAPAIASNPFSGDSATVYYLPGTAGWDAPQIQATGPSFGISTNQIGLSGRTVFGFAITGPNGMGSRVQACTNLSNPVWSAGPAFTIYSNSYYFKELIFWPNYYSSRFYRLSGRTFGGLPIAIW
jgi:hypothetical protein